MSKRGISPVVSYVLILAILVIIAVGSYIWANYMQNRMEDHVVVSMMENEMISLDNLIESVAHGDINYTVTTTVYYPSGILEIVPEKNWVRYLVQTQSEVYPPNVDVPYTTDGCTESSNATKDSDTGIVMVRLPFTHFYRGAVGSGMAERVEQVVCFPDIDLVATTGCIGKSGPSSQITLKKIGYNGTVPIVQVEIC